MIIMEFSTRHNNVSYIGRHNYSIPSKPLHCMLDTRICPKLVLSWRLFMKSTGSVQTVAGCFRSSWLGRRAAVRVNVSRRSRWRSVNEARRSRSRASSRRRCSRRSCSDTYTRPQSTTHYVNCGLHYIDH